MTKLTRQEAGRMGGQTTLARHGIAHMRRIGQAGFRALCCKFPENSRRKALLHLNGKGKLSARWVARPDPRDDEAWADLAPALGLDGTDEAPPF